MIMHCLEVGLRVPLTNQNMQEYLVEMHLEYAQPEKSFIIDGQ
jgi:hypothetical protein